MFYYDHDYVTKERLTWVIALDAIFEKWLVSFALVKQVEHIWLLFLTISPIG